jgi:hypothetical protein
LAGLSRRSRGKEPDARSAGTAQMMWCHAISFAD